MAEVFRQRGYRFFFYSADVVNEPPHVHITKQGNIAKYWLSPMGLATGGRFSDRQLNEIESLIQENLDTILAVWHRERSKVQ